MSFIGPPLDQIGQLRIGPEPGKRLRQRRFDGAGRAAEDLRHLRLGQVIEEAQDDDGPLPVRQLRQQATNREPGCDLGGHIPSDRPAGQHPA